MPGLDPSTGSQARPLPDTGPSGTSAGQAGRRPRRPLLMHNENRSLENAIPNGRLRVDLGGWSEEWQVLSGLVRHQLSFLSYSNQSKVAGVREVEFKFVVV